MRGQRPPVRVFAGGMERNPFAGAKRREDCGALRGEGPFRRPPCGATLPVRIFAGGKERNPLAGAKRREDCGALRRKAPSGGRHAGTTLPVRVFAGGMERNPLAGGGCCQSSSKRGGRRSGVALHGKGRARSDRMETGRCLKPAIRPEIAGDRACGTEVGRISRAPFQQSVGWKSAPRRKTDAAQAGGEGAVRFNRRSPPARRRPTAGGAAAPGPRRN